MTRDDEEKTKENGDKEKKAAFVRPLFPGSPFPFVYPVVVAATFISPHGLARPVARRTRVLVLLAFALAGAGLAFAGAMPEGYATVGDVVAGAAHGPADRVTIKASVLEGSLATDANGTRFVLTDGASDLPVVWKKALPDHETGGSIEGRTVVLTGAVVMEEGRPVLHGETMQVGCASKYERG